jgi:hypothetical protein
MRRHILPAAFFAGLAVVVTWPLVTSLGTHVPGRGADDNVNFLWNFWWMREALASSAFAFFHTDHLFYPFGVSLVLHTHASSSAFAGATLLGAWSIVAAQNILLLVAVALNGFCTYLLAFRLTRQRGAALVAGVYFAASPYFAGHLLGHFNLVPAWGLPLFILAFLAALERRRLAVAAAAGVVLAVIAYTDYYYVVYAGVMFAVLVAYRWWGAAAALEPRRRAAAVDWILLGLLAGVIVAVMWIAIAGGGVLQLGSTRVSMTSGFNLRIAGWLLALAIVWRRVRPRVRAIARDGRDVRADGRGIVAALVAAIALTAPLWLGALRIWRAGDYIAPPRLWRSSTGGVDLLTMVAGNPFHPWWRATGESIYATFGMFTIENCAWLGLLPVIYLVWARRTWLGAPTSRLWLAVGIGFFVWACGPYLTIAGRNTGLLLPETLLHYVPIVSNARIPGRAMVMVYLAVAMLLAMALSSRRSRRQTTVVMLVGAAVFLDFLSAPTWLYRLETPAIYQTLAAQPPGAVWELPFGVGDGFGERGVLDNATLFYQTTHHKPLVGGFVARLPRRLWDEYGRDPVLNEMLQLSEGATLQEAKLVEVRDSLREFMTRHDVKYLVVNLATIPNALLALVESLPMRVIEERDGRRLLAF